MLRAESNQSSNSVYSGRDQAKVAIYFIQDPDALNLRLVKRTPDGDFFWCAWKRDSHDIAVLSGLCGQRGRRRVLKSGPFKDPESDVRHEYDLRLADGFVPDDREANVALIIEYQVKGERSDEDVVRDSELADWLDEELFVRGLGEWDSYIVDDKKAGVICSVYDGDMTREILVSVLSGTRFDNYVDIYAK